MSASEGEDHQNRAGDARTASYPHHLYALGGVLRAGTTQGSSQRKKVGSIPDAPEAPGILVSLVPPLTSCSPLPLPFSSSSLSAVRVVSSAYLRLLIFLPAILIPAVLHSAQHFA